MFKFFDKPKSWKSDDVHAFFYLSGNLTRRYCECDKCKIWRKQNDNS